MALQIPDLLHPIHRVTAGNQKLEHVPGPEAGARMDASFLDKEEENRDTSGGDYRVSRGGRQEVRDDAQAVQGQAQDDVLAAQNLLVDERANTRGL